MDACKDNQMSAVLLFQDGSIYEISLDVNNYVVGIKNSLILESIKDGVIPKVRLYSENELSYLFRVSCELKHLETILINSLFAGLQMAK